MNKELKKGITAVLELLGERDPDWRRAQMSGKFKELYGGWVAQQLRRNIRTRDFYSRAWKRNWLPIDDWRQLRDYAMQ